MTSQRSVVFAEPVRTAIGTFGGSKDVTAPTLGSVAIGAAVADGRIRYREDITDRLENAPTAFIDMLQGRNFGKALCASHPQRDIFDFDRLNAAATAHRFDTSGAHWGNIACCCALAQAPLLFAARSTKPTRRRFPTSGL